MRPDDDLQEASSQEISEHIEIVVADTSPLNYLVQIDCVFVLPLLYRRIVAPPAVIDELGHNHSPLSVTSWVLKLPDWLEVVTTKTIPDARLCRLDSGERYALQLALEIKASEILIDEREGRKEAMCRGLSVIGTLGVLLEAQQAGLIDAYDALDSLTRLTTFRITTQLRQQFLAALGPHSGKD